MYKTIIVEPRTVEDNVVYISNHVLFVSQHFFKAIRKGETEFLYPYGTLVNR